jgi:putative PIN family toxin of toxin-antitoxin system
MMRVVLDTNVVVAGLRSRNGASAVVLELITEERLGLVLSGSLLDEYEDVLRRPEQRSAHGLSDDDLVRFLRGLVGRAELVPPRLERRLVLVRDPDDAVVAEAAIDGAADHLVTHNRRHFAEVHGVVSVLTPGALLRLLAEEQGS